MALPRPRPYERQLSRDSATGGGHSLPPLWEDSDLAAVSAPPHPAYGGDTPMLAHIKLPRHQRRDSAEAWRLAVASYSIRCRQATAAAVYSWHHYSA